ncbi:T9SS type A sorting domain-containing protein, partial [candidate division WOR-3 bacterium]|nr:T9SS type A sorting domain-containing protein [candidate division WOR-3 bacterium]
MALAIGKRFNLQPAACFVLCLTALSPLYLLAQDSLNVRFVGGYPFGGATGGIVSGVISGSEYVVASSGSGILIFNVDDPANPARVGQIISPIQALVPFLDDTLLYVAAQKQGLWIYNVADPSNPVMVNRWQPNDSVVQVYVCQNSAYVVSYTQMTILDVSDPTSPVVQGEWAPDSVLPYYVYVKDNYAYVCAAGGFGVNDALIILDLSDQTAPYEVGRCSPGNYMKLVVKSGYAYVAGWGLSVVDIADPTNPYVVRSSLVHFPVGNPQIKDNCLYVGGMFLSAFDITVPDDPVLMSHIPHQTHRITILNDHLHSMAIDRIEMLDITEPFFPFQVGEYEIMAIAYGLEVSDNFAVFGDTKNVFRIIDVTDPQGCFELGKYILNYPLGFMFDIAYGFTMAGDYLYVTAYDSGMRIVDISDLTDPHEVGYCYVPGLPPWYTTVRSVCVQGEYAYLGCSGSSGAGGYVFAVCNVSNPANPYFIGGIATCDTLGGINGVFINGHYAYCCEDIGLRIIDISNPYNPISVAKCSLSTYCDHIYVSGDYAYIADYDGGRLWIIDVSNPYNPSPAGYYYPIRVNDIYVAGDYAYLSDDHYGGGVRIFDVSNPANPIEVGYYRYVIAGNGPWHHGVTVSGGLIYTAAGVCGLWILDPYGIGIAETCNFSLNPRLEVSAVGRQVELSYLLTGSSAVMITLFDVCGRVVEKCETRAGPGMHHARLQTGFASGVYFVRVATEEWVETRKIVLLR